MEWKQPCLRAVSHLWSKEMILGKSPFQSGRENLCAKVLSDCDGICWANIRSSKWSTRCKPASSKQIDLWISDPAHLPAGNWFANTWLFSSVFLLCVSLSVIAFLMILKRRIGQFFYYPFEWIPPLSTFLTRLRKVEKDTISNKKKRLPFWSLLKQKTLFRESESGREDLNLRPLAPHASALAGLRHAPKDKKTL